MINKDGMMWTCHSREPGLTMAKQCLYFMGLHYAIGRTALFSKVGNSW